jgi:hypothetical protein
MGSIIAVSGSAREDGVANLRLPDFCGSLGGSRGIMYVDTRISSLYLSSANAGLRRYHRLVRPHLSTGTRFLMSLQHAQDLILRHS